MNYTISHTIDHPLERVEEAMLHRELPDYLVAHMSSAQEIEALAITDQGSVVERKIRYLPTPIIKRVGLKKVPPKAMEWIEHSTYDKQTHRLTFTNVATHPRVEKILSNHGVIALTQKQNKTIVTVTGELTIKVKVLGAIAERIVYNTAKRILDEEATTISNFIVEKGL